MAEFHIQNREALGRKIVEVARNHADSYRRNISQFNTANENGVAERCACAASNTAWFLLKELGYSNDDVKRLCDDSSLTPTAKEK